MGLITVEQYKESLNDGRVVYYKGEKIENVATHPDLGVCADRFRCRRCPEAVHVPELRSPVCAVPAVRGRVRR